MSGSAKGPSTAITLLVAAFVLVFAAVLAVQFMGLFGARDPAGAVAQAEAAPEGDGPVLEMELKSGTVRIRMRPDLAPNHVERLTTLAGQGFYDDIVFHRVIEGFMAQTGDPTGTGQGGSDLPDLDAEFSDAPFDRGTIGMARTSDPDSANSQFFIALAPARHLDGQYTVVGDVISGMEHVDEIKKGNAGANGMVDDPDHIIAMRVADTEASSSENEGNQ